MHVETLLRYLGCSDEAAAWLRSLGLTDLRRGHANLVSMARAGVTLDLLACVCRMLEEHLPACSDADMALNNLDRFVAAARNPLALAALFERDPEALPTLLQIFSTSQYLSDVLIADPQSYDLLRITEGAPVARDELVRELTADVAALPDDAAVMTYLRRTKRRETLRIAYGDLIRGQRIDVVTQQISHLADALVEAALAAAHRHVGNRRGVPRRSDGQRARLVVLGLGKLGGEELNYSSDIDLMFLYDADGRTDGPHPVANSEYFGRVAQEMVRLLTEPAPLGVVYRVDLRLRPSGARGPMVVNLDGARQYYDVMGRTWERQAFIKARPVAGDLDLGRELLQQLEPWIYRRYLSRADITGIKALKRRIEHRTAREGEDLSNVKTGRGGIRDIEFVIQFLQLLNGGDLPEARTGNTLRAILALEQVGCLTLQERSILEENYAFLRKIEHLLQILFDLRTHTLPRSDEELRKLALRMGYRPAAAALPSFRADYAHRTTVNRKILDHLLHEAFRDEGDASPEADLVLDPDPPPEMIREVLSKYGFRQVEEAYENLMALAEERVRFLSTRRCRHFLAGIAAELLRAIAATPDPDATLVDLSKVSDSLGGKGALWELFSFNPPTLNLYVRLCASSPYLSSILTTNPGMIDELMDSLLLDKLPTEEQLEAMLTDLARGAEDIDPILHSFKNSMHLRVGVRDILGKETIRATHRTLSDIAEVCVRQIAAREYERLVRRYGEPRIAGGRRDGQPCELLILALGKIGGREPNYHSDLDVIFLYEADGRTHAPRGHKSSESTSNQHFFSQLGQRIIKTITHLGPHGRLYEMDARLRPTGRSGALAVSLGELHRYHLEGQGQLWERQSLCKARPIFGSLELQERAMRVVRDILTTPVWEPHHAEEIRQMRRRLEESASPWNLKRAVGGTVDLEFLVQMLQLRHAAQTPSVLVPGTLAALEVLRAAGHLSAADFDYLTESYTFLRSIEARLRLMNTTARHDIPTDPRELAKLAYLLGRDSAEALQAECEHYMAENRRVFDRIFDEAARA